jgi:YHS domain-containing protein
MAKCPVCGKEVDEGAARVQTGHTMHGAAEVDPSKGTRSFHDGKWYYFDSVECRGKFAVNPATYLEQAGT